MGVTTEEEGKSLLAISDVAEPPVELMKSSFVASDALPSSCPGIRVSMRGEVDGAILPDEVRRDESCCCRDFCCRFAEGDISLCKDPSCKCVGMGGVPTELGELPTSTSTTDAMCMVFACIAAVGVGVTILLVP